VWLILLARHQAGQEQGGRPRNRDHVQADDQAEAVDLTGDADHRGQDVDRDQPVNDRHSSGLHWLRIKPGSHGHSARSPSSSCRVRG
jgi:hypothetical protein